MNFDLFHKVGIGWRGGGVDKGSFNNFEKMTNGKTMNETKRLNWDE